MNLIDKLKEVRWQQVYCFKCKKEFLISKKTLFLFCFLRMWIKCPYCKSSLWTHPAGDTPFIILWSIIITFLIIIFLIFLIYDIYHHSEKSKNIQSSTFLYCKNRIIY